LDALGGTGIHGLVILGLGALPDILGGGTKRYRPVFLGLDALGGTGMRGSVISGALPDILSGGAGRHRPVFLGLDALGGTGMRGPVILGVGALCTLWDVLVGVTERHWLIL
jgi:hypothetical protein